MASKITIQRRINGAFAMIILIIAGGGLATAWSNRVRTEAVSVLQRALSRQELLSAVQDNLGARRKQLALLGQTFVRGDEGGLDRNVLQAFTQQMNLAKDNLDSMRTLSEAGAKREIDVLTVAITQLADGWTLVLSNYGVDHAKAVTHEATVCDPLSERILTALIPALQGAESERTRAAQARFELASRRADQTIFLVIFLSIGLAMVVGWSLRRRISGGIQLLERGANAIGDGDLEHRVNMTDADELTDLAHHLNAMADKLQESQSKLLTANSTLARRNEDVEHERRIADALLRNILPDRIATELQTLGHVEPRLHSDVSVLFTDFVGFSQTTEQTDPSRLVEELDDYFTAFDRITKRYGLEKLKTIGDSYMVAGGLPLPKPGHQVDIIMAAMEMLSEVERRSEASTGARWQMRVGLHIGPVVAGVVGIQKFAFDIWGATVNLASRMESSGVPGAINISSDLAAQVNPFFELRPRGDIMTKDGVSVPMFLVKSIRRGLISAETQSFDRFESRYREEFGGLPPSHPSAEISPTTHKASAGLLGRLTRHETGHGTREDTDVKTS